MKAPVASTRKENEAPPSRNRAKCGSNAATLRRKPLSC
jgi:hypothetical protein